MITYEEMEQLSRRYAKMFEKGPCTTCYGGRTETACWEWLEQLGHAKSRNCHGRFYANKEECNGLLKYWNDKEGFIDAERQGDKMEESTFVRLKRRIDKNYNSNFRYDRLDWVSRVWIQELCDLIDELKDSGGKEQK